MMARPYNAWGPDPAPHRHFGHHFADYNNPAVLLPSPDGMMSTTSNDARRIDDPRRLQPVAPVPPGPTYHGAYGSGRLLPPSSTIQVPLANYRNAPSFTNAPTQVFSGTNRMLNGSPYIEPQAQGYQDVRMVKPAHPSLPPPQRLSVSNEQPAPARKDSLPDYHVGTKRTSMQVTSAEQALAVNPPPPPPQQQQQQQHSEARRHSHISVPNLIGEGRAEALKDIKFRLRLRQQPKAARSCGFGERDRRVIDPPPIVELMIDSPTLSEEEIRTYRCFESYVMSCSIWDESGKRDASYMPEEYRHQRRLMGSLVGTPFVGKDEHGKEGCFFTFSDLSCRTPGSFRLKFSVMMIDPLRAGMIRHFPILTEVQSDVFTVYNAKDFPGMVASTQLAHSLKAQGCILQLKKGNDKAKNPKSAQDLSEDDLDDNDDDADLQGKRKRRSIR